MSGPPDLSRRRLLQSGAAALALGTTATGSVQSSQEHVAQTVSSWPQIHKGPGNTGYAAGAGGPYRAVETDWTVDLAGTPYSPVVADGRIYVGTYGGNNSLYAFDADTGDELWRRGLDIGTRVAPVVAGETVVVVTEDWRMYGVAADSGSTEWTYFDWSPVYDEPMEYEPVVADDVIYMPVRTGTVDGAIHAIDATDGTRIWQYENDYWHPNRTPAVADGTIYAGFNDRIVALDTAGGDQQWTFTTAGRATTPVVAEGSVFVGARGNIYRLDTDDGSLTWRNTEGFRTQSPPAVDRSRVYYEDSFDIVALDIDDGSIDWTYSSGATNTGSSPVVANSAVYYWDWESNVCHGIDAGSGDELWTLDLGSQNDLDDGELVPHPALVGGRLYLGNLNGTLYAVGGDPPTETIETQSSSVNDDEDDTDGGGIPVFSNFSDDSSLPKGLLALTLVGYGGLTLLRRTNEDRQRRDGPPPRQ